MQNVRSNIILKEEWLNNWGHIYTGEYYTAIKKKKKMENIWESPGGPVVRTQHSHC